MSKPHIEEELPVQDGLSRTLKDLFAGAVGGVAQVLIGQPFGEIPHVRTAYETFTDFVPLPLQILLRSDYKQHRNTPAHWTQQPRSTKMKEPSPSTREP